MNQHSTQPINRPNYLFSVAITILLFAWHPSKAQDTYNLSVSCAYSQEAVTTILSDLESRYPIEFHYKEEWMDGIQYTGNFEQINLLELMDRIVQNSGLTYVPIRNQIFLAPRYDLISVLGETADFRENGQENGEWSSTIIVGNPVEAGMHRKFRVHGVVRDGTDGETLIGATIKVANTSDYAVTGFEGDYSLELTPGNYELEIMSLGFEDQRIEIQAVGPGTLDIDLFESSHEISEVRVYAQRRDHNVRSNQMSLVELDARTIKQLPVMIGERDIVKSLTMAPGVKSVGEFGSGINVRGGGEDQNLYLVEGAPLFNTSHVMGLLSVINPDAVNSVSLYKGHIPADYGERVSSVMNIQLRDYGIEQAHVKGGIGLFSSRLQVETPILTPIVTLKVGGRTSYSDYLLGRIPDFNLMNSSAEFYDLSGVLNLNLNKNPISIMGYHSRNYFRYVDMFSNEYDNTLGSFSWSHLFTPDLSSNLTLAYSNYNVERNETSDELFEHKVNSSIEYISGKLRFRYEGINNHTIDLGGQAIQYNLNPGIRTPFEESWSTRYETRPEAGQEFSVFINDAYEITPNTSLQAGVRLTRYQYLGPQTVYHYQEGMPRMSVFMSDSTVYADGETVDYYDAIEPRISLMQMLTEESSIKLSYNRNTQFLSLMAYTSISTPEDIWKLSDPHLKPVIANQWALGYYRNFSDNDYEASIEGYYKQIDNVMEYRNGAQLSLNNHIETELLDAIGYNYGVEFMLKKNSGKLHGTFTYTYSRSLRQTLSGDIRDQINRNEMYPSQYDKPNDLSLTMNYNYNRRLRFGANFSYSTGRPITLPEYIYSSNNNQLVYYSDRNQYRLPDYHRLDLSVSMDENLKRRRSWKGSWTFSLLNVYGRKNAYSVFYKRDEPTPENNFRMFSLFKLYMIGIPLPTLTYNFIF